MRNSLFFCIAPLSVFLFTSTFIWSVSYAEPQLFDIDVEGVEHELGFDEIDFSGNAKNRKEIQFSDSEEQAAMMRVVAALREARLAVEKSSSGRLTQGPSKMVNESIRSGGESEKIPPITYEGEDTGTVRVNVPTLRPPKSLVSSFIGGGIASLVAHGFGNFDTETIGNLKTWIQTYSYKPVVEYKTIRNLREFFWVSFQSYWRSIDFRFIGQILQSYTNTDAKQIILKYTTIVLSGSLFFAVTESFRKIFRSKHSPLKTFGLLSDVLSATIGSVVSSAIKIPLLFSVIGVPGIKQMLILEATVKSISYSLFQTQKYFLEKWSKKRVNFFLHAILGGVATALAVISAFKLNLIHNLPVALTKYIPSFIGLYCIYESITDNPPN